MTAPSKQPDTCFVHWKGKTADTCRSYCLRKTKEHQRNHYGNLFTYTLAELLLVTTHTPHTPQLRCPHAPHSHLSGHRHLLTWRISCSLYLGITGTSVAGRLTSEHLKRSAPFPSESQLYGLFRFACHVAPHHWPVPLPEMPWKGALLEPGTVVTKACAAGLLSHTKCP